MTKSTATTPKIKRLNVNLDAELHAAFKSAVAAQKTDMGTVLAEFIKQYVRRHLPSARR
jgi:hypothetical protein